MPRTFRLALAVTSLVAACAAARPTPPANPAPGRAPGLAPAPPPEEHWASARAIQLYLESRLAAAEGNRHRALDALRLALVHDPLSPQIRTSYAEELARSGRLEAAQGEAFRAIELAPPGAAAADAHLALGRIMAQSRRPADAVRAFQTAALIEGDRVRALPEAERDLDPEPWRMLARTLYDAGDVPGSSAACEALALLDRAEGAAGLRELAHRLLEAKNAVAAEGRLKRAVELAPAEPDGWKLLARLEEGRERFAAARAAWEQALRADPDDPDALQSAAQLALREGDLDGARAWLGQLVVTSPDEVSAKLRVTAAWLDARRPAEALEASAGGDDDRLLYMRGLALEALRRWAEAAQVFGRVTTQAGEVYGLARQRLALALLRAGKAGEAVRALQLALEQSPRDPRLLYALGAAYEQAGQHEEALAQMRIVLRVKPDHAEAMNFVGYAFADRGERLDEAQVLVEKALEIEPDNGAYLDSLGWVLLKRGHPLRALEVLERAARLLGSDATVLEHLGDAYRAAHRLDDAAAAYRRALGGDDGDDALAPAHRISLQRKLESLGARDEHPAQTRR